ncbi:MAG: hypothetical protein WAL29_13090 [Bacteroidales bacterium]
MEQISLSDRTDAIDKISKAGYNEILASTGSSRTAPVYENIITEGGEDFFKYLTWIGLAKEPEMMVLSSIHHYHYDHSDLRGIKVLINLKKLNQIRHLDGFLHTLSKIMPAKACLSGYFMRSHHGTNTYGHYVKVLRELLSLMDPGKEKNLPQKNVEKLLEKNHFTILDMTEINGITYFWAQNSRHPGE